MKVNELQARQGKVDIELDILDIGEPREFEKFGKRGRVATAVAKDDTGDVKMTLWNDDIDKIKAGDKVKINNGYVGEWQGELQLSTGKFGKLEIVEGDAQPESKLPETPQTLAEPVSGSGEQPPEPKKDPGLNQGTTGDEEDVI